MEGPYELQIGLMEEALASSDLVDSYLADFGNLLAITVVD